MSYFEAILLGLVQGLGEFLPISSSGHLVVFPWFFNFKDPGLAFDVALHFGTFAALIAFFWKDWIQILTESRKIFLWIVLATIPAAIVGVLFDDLIEANVRHPLIVATTMAMLGVVLWRADVKGNSHGQGASLTLKKAIIIGLSQTLALIPGVSRSGITITAALFCGLDRVQAARFSFLLATPITLGACVLKADDFFKESFSAQALVGILVSMIVGFVAIKYLLKYVQTKNYFPFVIYRFIFAIVVFGLYFLR